MKHFIFFFRKGFNFTDDFFLSDFQFKNKEQGFLTSFGWYKIIIFSKFHIFAYRTEIQFYRTNYPLNFPTDFSCWLCCWALNEVYNLKRSPLFLMKFCWLHEERYSFHLFRDLNEENIRDCL